MNISSRMTPLQFGNVLKASLSPLDTVKKDDGTAFGKSDLKEITPGGISYAHRWQKNPFSQLPVLNKLFDLSIVQKFLGHPNDVVGAHVGLETYSEYFEVKKINGEDTIIGLSKVEKKD